MYFVYFHWLYHKSWREHCIWCHSFSLSCSLLRWRITETSPLELQVKTSVLYLTLGPPTCGFLLPNAEQTISHAVSLWHCSWRKFRCYKIFSFPHYVKFILEHLNRIQMQCVVLCSSVTVPFAHFSMHVKPDILCASAVMHVHTYNIWFQGCCLVPLPRERDVSCVSLDHLANS